MLKLSRNRIQTKFQTDWHTINGQQRIRACTAIIQSSLEKIEGALEQKGDPNPPEQKGDPNPPMCVIRISHFLISYLFRAFCDTLAKLQIQLVLQHQVLQLLTLGE